MGLFTNIPVDIPLSSPIEACISKLRTSTERIPRAYPRSRLRGVVAEDKVRLHLVGMLPHRPYQPVFLGRIVDEAGAATLRGNIRSPRILRLFVFVWLSFACVWTLATLYAETRPDEDPAIRWLPLAGVLFVGVSLAFFFVINVFVRNLAEQLRREITSCLR